MDLSQLMGRDRPEATLRFGSSLVTKSLIRSYVGKGYFEAGVCQAPEGEDMPDPREGETVVFHNLFSHLAFASPLTP